MTSNQVPLVTQPEIDNAESSGPSIDPGIKRLLGDLRVRGEAQNRQLLANFTLATKTDPNLAGEAQRMGLDLSLDSGLVTNNIAKVREIWQRRAMRERIASGGDSATMKAMIDPEFMRVALDDSEHLGFIENLWRQRSAAKLQERRSILWEHVRSKGEDRAKAELLAIDRISRQLEDLPPDSNVGGFFENLGYGAMRTWSGMETTVLRGLGRGASQAAIAVGLGQMGPQAALPEELVSVPLMFGSGFFGEMIGRSAMVETGAAYGEMVGMGVDPQIASRWALGAGLLSGMLEGVGAGVATRPVRGELKKALTKKLAKELLSKPVRSGAAIKFAKDYAIGLGGEVVTETMQTLTQHMAEWGALQSNLRQDPGADLEGSDPLGDKIVQTMAETLRGMALLGLPGPLVQLRGDLARAKKAQGDERFFNDLADGIGKSKTQQRNKRMMHRFLEQLADGTPADTVYIPVDDFRKVLTDAGMTDEQLAELAPEVSNSFSEATDTGTVEIPTAGYGASFLSSDLGRMLIPFSRFDPEGMSPQEAASVTPDSQQKMADEVENILKGDLKTDEVTRESADQVEQQIASQIQAAGMTPEQSSIAAKYYRHVAIKLAREEGLTPMEWHQQKGVEFLAESEFADVDLDDADGLQQSETIDIVKSAWDAEGVTGSLSERGSLITVDSIVVPEESRGQGLGSAAMRSLTAYADRTGQKIALTPSLDLGATSKRRLEKFYQSHGFKNNSGPKRDFEVSESMVRDPVASNRGTNILHAGSLGKFLPDLRAILLSEDANPSTVFHEMSHFWFFSVLDMAERGKAGEKLLGDINTLLDWFKIDGEDASARMLTWQSMSLEQQRKHHEALAREFEIYLHDGQAPTAGLGRIFAKIRAWMVNVYTSIRDELNAIYRGQFGEDLPGLTPEVRQVFDRMVASEKAVEMAESVRAMRPAFQTIEEFQSAGFSEQEWNGYQQTLQDARDEAVTDLNSASLRQLKWLTGARSRLLKEKQKGVERERARVEAKVRDEVENERVYVEMGLVREGVAAEKMLESAVDDVLKLFPVEQREAIKKHLGTGRKGMMSKSGLTPDIIADQLGYNGAASMIRAFADARPIDDEVAIRTTQRLLEDHSELLDKQAIDRAVDQALHGEARARFIAKELRFLERSQTPIRITRAAAKQAAMVNLGKRRIKDIRPDRFSRLESKHALDAEKAMKPGKDGKGDPDAAVAAKRRQMLTHEMTKQAYAIREEIGKATSRMRRRLERPNEKLAKSGNVDLLQAARHLLSIYGILSPGAQVRTSEYMDLVRTYDPDLFARVEPQFKRAARRAGKLDRRKNGEPDWKAMKVDEFRGLISAADELMYRAVHDREITAAGKREQIAAVVEELVPLLDQADDLPGELSRVTDPERRSKRFQTTKAKLTKAESILRHFGQGFLTYIHDPIKDALTKSRTDSAVYTKRFLDMFKDMRKKGLLDNQPGLEYRGYSFGGGTRGNSMVELMGALLQMGNKGNKEKFLVAGRGEGRSWADGKKENGEYDFTSWDGFVQDLVDKGILTEAHFDAIQGVWDLLDEIKPLLQDAHKQLNGYSFREVPAQPFEVEFPDGTVRTFRGGYLPAIKDPDIHIPQAFNSIDQQLRELEQDFNYGLPKVPDGHTKERDPNYLQRALSMDLSKVAAHIDTTIRYAHLQPRVAEVLRLLNNQDMNRAFERSNPGVIQDIIMPWLMRATTQSLYKPSEFPTVDNFMRALRVNTGIMTMFGNVVNSAQQLTGISNAAEFVEAKHLASAVGHLIRHPLQIQKSIRDMSEFMETRMSDQAFGMTSELREMSRDPSKVGQFSQMMTKNAYFMQAWTQNITDSVTWWGKYNEQLEAGVDQDTAVKESDRAVRLSQGSFDPEDLAQYEVGTAFHRSLVQFTSYFNTVLNSLRFTTRSKPGVFLRTFAIPMIVAQAIYMVLRGDWEEDEYEGRLDLLLMDTTIYPMVSGAASLAPAVGPFLARTVEKVFSDREYGDRVASAPGISRLAGALIGSFRAAEAMYEGRDVTSRNAKDMFEALALTLPGFGAEQAAAALAGLTPIATRARFAGQVATGDVEPTSGADLARGLVTGVASRDSRQ